HSRSCPIAACLDCCAACRTCWPTNSTAATLAAAAIAAIAKDQPSKVFIAGAAIREGLHGWHRFRWSELHCICPRLSLPRLPESSLLLDPSCRFAVAPEGGGLC